MKSIDMNCIFQQKLMNSTILYQCGKFLLFVKKERVNARSRYCAFSPSFGDGLKIFSIPSIVLCCARSVKAA